MEQDDRDKEIRDLIADERARGRKAPTVVRERRLREFAAGATKAKQAKDARTFTELLKNAGIPENSPEWARAWKFFYGP